jgi:NAD-dependent dihydropyrimidine dehydrogenase PreA subunit
MIEIVSQTACIHCDKCVKVCPTDVFDSVPDGAPVIARQEDCQTCFLCEAYCPVDALFVAANAYGPEPVIEEEVRAKGLWGKYRRELGWTPAFTTKDRIKETRELGKRIREANERQKLESGHPHHEQPKQN